MQCKECEKQLKGGFEQEDGSFLCANCTIRQVERNSDKQTLEKIEGICTEALEAGKRPTKKQVRKILSLARAILSVRKLG